MKNWWKANKTWRQGIIAGLLPGLLFLIPKSAFYWVMFAVWIVWLMVAGLAGACVQDMENNAALWHRARLEYKDQETDEQEA